MRRRPIDFRWRELGASSLNGMELSKQRRPASNKSVWLYDVEDAQCVRAVVGGVCRWNPGMGDNRRCLVTAESGNHKLRLRCGRDGTRKARCNLHADEVMMGLGPIPWTDGIAQRQREVGGTEGKGKRSE